MFRFVIVIIVVGVWETFTNEIKQGRVMQKYNRLQIAVSEKNAKTIRKMYVQ